MWVIGDILRTCVIAKHWHICHHNGCCRIQLIVWISKKAKLLFCFCRTEKLGEVIVQTLQLFVSYFMLFTQSSLVYRFVCFCVRHTESVWQTNWIWKSESLWWTHGCVAGFFLNTKTDKCTWNWSEWWKGMWCFIESLYRKRLPHARIGWFVELVCLCSVNRH